MITSSHKVSISYIKVCNFSCGWHTSAKKRRVVVVWRGVQQTAVCRQQYRQLLGCTRQHCGGGGTISVRSATRSLKFGVGWGSGQMGTELAVHSKEAVTSG
jgi:hypothetical protein